MIATAALRPARGAYGSRDNYELAVRTAFTYSHCTGGVGHGPSNRTLRIDVSANGLPVSDPMRRRVEQRLVYALSRFGAGVERVTVQLSDEKNALGGLDRRCRVRAWLRNRGTVAVETLDGRGSFGRAADRLEARIEWALVGGPGEIPAPLPLTLAAPPPSKRTALTGSGRRKAPSSRAGQKRRRP